MARNLSKMSSEIDVVNTKIIKLFKKHHIKPGRGEEAFYSAIKQVAKKSKSDAKKLTRLGNHWAVQMSFNLSRG